MKRICNFLTVLLIVLLLTACGDVSNVERVMRVSECYTETEIHDAMDIVTAYFREEFDGCRLKNLRYDEPLAEQQEWAKQYDADEAIVLESSFYVIGSKNPTLNPNSTYRGWEWILTRTGNGNWELQTCGY